MNSIQSIPSIALAVFLLSSVSASAQTVIQKNNFNTFLKQIDETTPSKELNNTPVQVAPTPPNPKTLPKNFVENAGPLNKGIKAKIGQMVMVGFRGTSPKHRGVRAVMDELREGSIGGVMLMRHNVVSIRQLSVLTRALRHAARQGGKPPPFISVDQEGGLVQRLKFIKYPSASKIARKSPKSAGQIYSRMACEVRSAGINVNFGPVVDVDVQGRANPVIGRLNRSYSPDADKVALYAGKFVEAHKRYGLMTAAKHFPGHGSSLKDSHKGFTAIPQWDRARELTPFKKLARRGVEMVMVGHLYNRQWGAPASLSHKAIAGMLRNQVGFTGVAITDDMEMGAIRKNYKWSTAIKLAVNAGNDVLLYSNTARYSPFLGREIRNTIALSLCSASNTSKSCVPQRAINNAYARILTVKRNRHRINAFKNAKRCVSGQTRNARKTSTKQTLVR